MDTSCPSRARGVVALGTVAQGGQGPWRGVLPVLPPWVTTSHGHHFLGDIRCTHPLPGSPSWGLGGPDRTHSSVPAMITPLPAVSPAPSSQLNPG